MKTLKTSDLWVVYRQGSTDLDELFLKKEDAELVYEKCIEDMYKHYRKEYTFLNDFEYENHFKNVYLHTYSIITLDEALINIKDYLSECPNCQDASY